MDATQIKKFWLIEYSSKIENIFPTLGVVGIISPWNYPIDLTLSPLVYAVATGNRVMIKPSEHTPKTSKLLQTLVSKYFDIEHVAVCCGDINVGIEFSKLPFDHLMFTGSTSTGKLVMAEAARNLLRYFRIRRKKSNNNWRRSRYSFCG